VDDIATPVSASDAIIVTEDNDGDDLPITSIPMGARSIRTDSADPEVESLYNKWKRGKLFLQPSFQREFVWDKTKASRLIESALIAVPIPIIYLAEEQDERESVIDGQQRLTSFFSFIDGQFPNGETFRLSGLRILPELNRKTFKDLEERMQDRVRYCQLRTIKIRNDSDPDLRFEIFERLNTGAAPLNNMELRNCIYRGRYMDLVRELSKDTDFLDLTGFKKPDTRMRDVELVLRFAAFYNATYLKYKGPMKNFLNKDMLDHQDINETKVEEIRKAFKNAIQIIRSLFGERAFKRFFSGSSLTGSNGGWETKRLNASLYTVLMVTFCDRDKNRVYSALDLIREELIDVMASDSDFIDAILSGTSEASKITRSFDKVRMLVDEILSNHKQQPRCFSMKLKQELYEANPTCTICEQKIQDIDDASVDHIHQYWKGGKTIPENARLTHRYCNMKRSKND